MTGGGARRRADLVLVAQGLAASRAEAQAAIAEGNVRANGQTITKPSQCVPDGVEIDYRPAHPYVSRGALKLVAALDHFGLSPRELVCLDIGASTGGFTDVLLTRGARRVIALDVGHGQLHRKLAEDPRVVLREGVNARDLTREQLGESPGALTADVSFISLTLALRPALDLAQRGAWLMALVKPQFEVGRALLGKGGIVRDEAARHAACDSVCAWISSVPGWIVSGAIVSPVPGGDGNREFLVAARKS